MRRLRAGTFERKNRQFLANPVGTGYCFSEVSTARLALRNASRREGLGVRSDSLAALQAIGIAKNGLANSSPCSSAPGSLRPKIRNDLIGGRQGRLRAEPRC